jgi:hypothetical protein
MKIFSILIQDRHCDPEVEMAGSLDAAIDRAYEAARQIARHADQIEALKIDGLTLFISCSGEGDSVSVKEHELEVAP